MNKRILAGKEIYPIGLGAMALEEYREKASEEEAIELFKFAVESGVELIDTADVYGFGRSETLIGRVLTQKQKERIIVTTKAGCIRTPSGGWERDCRPQHIKEAIKGSLQRLNVKKIFLYQLHTADPNVSLKDSLLAFKELQEQNTISYFGVSNFSLEQIKYAQGIIKVASVQNHFNLAFKQDEEELLPYLKNEGITYLPYFPLGSGKRYGFLLKDARLAELAKSLSLTSAQLALAWILNKWPNAIPIPGTKSKEHLTENLAAAEVSLPKSIIDELDKLY